MFELQTGGKVSYKDYLQKQYGIKSIKNEMCVVKDKSGAVFLPQHIRLTITSKQSDLIYDEVLNFVNPRTDERLNRIETFVQHINNAQRENKENKELLNLDFEIDEESLNTSAIVLQMPDITIQGENGAMDPQPVDDFKYFQTRGFLGNTQRLKNWAIVFEKRHGKSFEMFVHSLRLYMKKRHFDENSGPIAIPDSRPCPSLTNILDETANDLLHKGIVQQGDQMLVIILPDGMRGSEIKAKFTKIIQSSAFKNACLIQCINNNTCFKSNACLGTFEDIMIKFGNVPYRIDPCLPNKGKYIDINSTWVWGIDVSHVSNKPSVVMVSISRKPFEGSLRSMHFVAHLNPCRKEIVAFNNMVNLAFECIVEAYKATNKEKERLPHNIIIFRDGVADGQIPELFTKEVCGIQRSVTVFREKYNLKKWKPKLTFILCNKNTIDRFGLLDQNTGLCKPLNQPCVIYDHILSDRLWDFIIFPYHFKKNSDRTKGVRYIVLLDQLELFKEKKVLDKACLDLFQFIFGLTYMFAFSIPFPLGGTAQPAPIVYAKHYAESFSQSILSSDKSLKDLQLHDHLNRPHVVTNQYFIGDIEDSKENAPSVIESQISDPVSEK